MFKMGEADQLSLRHDAMLIDSGCRSPGVDFGRISLRGTALTSSRQSQIRRCTKHSCPGVWRRPEGMGQLIGRETKLIDTDMGRRA